MSNKSFVVYIICLLVLLASCATDPPQVDDCWVSCASLPAGRASACATVLNGKAYAFGGRDSAGVFRNDLWQYDPAQDTWTTLGATPLKARVNAAITAVDDALYLGLGYSARHAYNDSAYQRDWWRFTPANSQWKRLANFPNQNTVAATLAVIGKDIYALYGCGHAQQKEVWRYTIATDTWSQLPEADNALPRAFGCKGAVCANVLYFGTGFNSKNLRDWFMVTLPDNQWTSRKDIPGKGREFSACTATDDHVYLFGGRYFGGDISGGEVFDTYLRYHPATDSWAVGKMPCGHAENQIAFTIDGIVYFGLGEDACGKPINKLYRLE